MKDCIMLSKIMLITWFVKTILIIVIYRNSCSIGMHVPLCPDISQWNLRAASLCSRRNPSYVCLFDDNEKKYTEFCARKPDAQTPGYKFVIRGGLDSKECEKNRYQPFKLTTDGHSQCIFKKTKCIEEGQIQYNNGTATSNTLCKCDYTNSYNFISITKRGCFCDPSQEDCSCYKMACPNGYVLSPDYTCMELERFSGNNHCPEIKRYEIQKDIHIKKDDYFTTQSFKEVHQPVFRKNKICAIIIIFLMVIATSAIGIVIRKGKDEKDITSQTEDIDELQQKENEHIPPEIRALPNTLSIKQCVGANYQELVSKINSSKIVETLVEKNVLTTADRCEIENILHKYKRNHILLRKVWNGNELLYNEFISALSKHSFTDLATSLELQGKNENDITSQTEDIDKLQQKENEHIPPEIREQFEQQIMQWREDDKLFVETKASKDVARNTRSHGIAFVVAPTGNGKTSIIRHVALNLSQDEGFDIVPFVKDPNMLFKFYQSNRKQAFILDDIGGRDKINTNSLETWIKGSQKIANSSGEDSLFLMACNPCVLEGNSFEHMSKFKYDLLCYVFTQEERTSMLTKYALDIPDGLEYQFRGLAFPLLCRLSREKRILKLQELFADPVKHIREEIESMQQKKRKQFFLITLCAICQDGFEKNVFHTQGKNRNIFLQLCQTMQITIDTENDEMAFFSKELKVMQETYLYLDNNKFNFIHEKIYEIAAFICGTNYYDLFLSHASSCFIGERYRLGSCQSENVDNLIKIQNDKPYFKRLIDDLDSGISYSTFQNKQLDDSCYRKSFVTYCNEYKDKLTETLSKFKSLGGEEQNDNCCLSNQYCSPQNRSELHPLLQAAHMGYVEIVKMLIDMKCSIDERDRNGRSALFIAAYCGYVNIVNLLIEIKAQINLCDYMKRSPLHASSLAGHSEIVEWLIKSTADINICDIENKTALYVACEAGNTDVVKVICEKGGDVLIKTQTGATILSVAVKHGKQDVVKYLLSLKDLPLLETRDNRGMSPLFTACQEGNLIIAAILVTQNASVLSWDMERRTPLHIVSKTGKNDIVKLLLEESREPLDKQDDNKHTPLWIACKQGHIDVVKTMMKYTPKIDVADGDEKSPLHVACTEGHFDIVETLINHRANINHVDKDKRSPLFYACKAGHNKIVEFLLKNGAEKNLCDQWNTSPLYIACQANHINVVQCLLEKDANISICAEKEYSPLHIACNEGFKSIVQLLLNHRANVSLKDSNGETPLDLAKDNKHKDIIELFDIRDSHA